MRYHRGQWLLRKAAGWRPPYKNPTKQSWHHVGLFRKWVAALPDRLPPGKWVHPLLLFTHANWLRAEDQSVPVFHSGAELAAHLRRQGPPVLAPEQVQLLAQAVAKAAPYGAVEGPHPAAAVAAAASPAPATTATVGAAVPASAAAAAAAADDAGSPAAQPSAAAGPDPATAGSGVEAALGAAAADLEAAAVPDAAEGGSRVREGRRSRDGRSYVTVDGSREAAEEVHREYLRQGRSPSALRPDPIRPHRWFFYLDDGGRSPAPSAGPP